MKPPLILKEQDFSDRDMRKKPSKKLLENFKADLISVLQFMIDNKKTLKLRFGCNFESSCGTYRDMIGWWAYWLGIPIIHPRTKNNSKRFSRFYSVNAKLFEYFEQELYFGMAFYSGAGTLIEKLKLAKSLKL